MRPDSAIVVIVTDANGTTKTLGSGAPDPGDRPQGIQFSTQIGSGFYTGSFSLTRAVDRDNEDLHLGDDVRFIGANGEIAYEGYITALPRSMDTDGHSLTVSCAGWAAALADNPFSMPFVDRDLSKWTGVSTTRRLALLQAAAPGPYGLVGDPSVSPDQTGSQALRTAFTGAWTTGRIPIAEAWYDAGSGVAIGRITATWTRGPNIIAADTNWSWQMTLSSDDTASSYDQTLQLRAAGPGDTSLAATTTRRFAQLILSYVVSPNGADGTEYGIDWTNVAIYGNHDLPLLGAAAPYGVSASDVIRWAVANYAPLIGTAGVKDTTYPIAHLVADDMTVNDLILKVNSYHNWLFGVWEDRTLHFAPYDADEWQWEIRHDEMGNTIGLQGDEFTDLRNRIRVKYTNVETGKLDVLTGDDYEQLRDDSISNPLNVQGRTRSGEAFTVPYPTTRDNALELGRIRLLEDNAPKAPGSFTCAHYVRDRAGSPQPAWKVRAGDRVRLTSSANLSDRPRLVNETSYGHDGKTVTVSVDSTSRVLDALLDRTTTALAAAGLQ